MAKIHSKTDEKWIAHVGMLSAFSGSSKGKLKEERSMFPSPPRKGVCASKLNWYIHIYTNIYIYTYTYIHTYIYIYIRTFTLYFD
jgi:hypothetical protein